MAIRKKSLIIVMLTFICFIAVLYFGSRAIILRGFNKLDENSVNKSVKAALDVLGAGIRDLDERISDWVNRQAPHSFIINSGKDLDFTDQSFLDLRINFIIITDGSGKILSAKGFDLVRKKRIFVPDALFGYLNPQSIFIAHGDDESSSSGILLLPEGPLFIVSKAVSSEKTAAGFAPTIIFCRYLDPEIIEKLADEARLNITFHKITDIVLPSEFNLAQFLFSKSEQIIILPLSAEEIAGYGVVKDVFGNPVFVLRVTAPRQAYKQADFALKYFLIALVVFGVVLGGVLFIYFVSEISKRERSENRIAKLNESFLSFGADPLDNINRLTALCGELLDADYALYNRLYDGKLCSFGQWNIPNDFKDIDVPDGHICWDVIKEGNEEVKVIKNLLKTRYADSDPNIKKYNFDTYIGRAVKTVGGAVGSLCVIYRRDFILSKADRRIIGIIAAAVEVEENRWQIEKELRESEERYRKITSSVTDYIITVRFTKDGFTMVDCSPACSAITGYTREEFMSNPSLWIDILPGSDKEILNKQITGIISYKETRSVDYRIIRKDGKIRWVRNTPVLKFEKNGDLIGCEEVIRDITEQKLAEEALLESERKMAALLSNLPGMAYRCKNDSKRTMEFVSSGCLEMTGYHPEEIFDNRVVSYQQLIHSDDREYVINEIQTRVNERKDFRFEYRIFTAAKEEKWVWEQGRGIYSPEGVLLGLEGFISDISERKRAEERLNKVLDVTRTLLERMPFGVIVVGKDRKIRQINTAALNMIGRDSDQEIINRVCHEVICPAQEGGCPVLDLNEVVDTSEKRIIAADGRHIPILKTVLPISLGEEELLLEAFVDITERKRAEEVLLNSKKEAEMASRIKSIFLANMSHEIRTPMNAIIGFSELLENTRLDYVQKDYVSVILESGQILLALINDILDFSKIEAGELHLEQIDFDLEYLIRSVIKINSTRLNDKDIELFCVIDEKMPKSFNGDPTRIRQILINLLSNAVKFTEEGAIGISVSIKAPVEDEVKEGGMCLLQFSVKDSGVGIPKDKQESIFDAFEQADTSTTRRYGGTGLGLTICKALVKMMGGEIWVESEPGRGSEFFFTVRLRETAPVVEKEIQPLASDLLKGKKAVIIDDSEIARKIMEEYCKELGLDVVFKAESAEAALEWFSSRQELPDIVISDIIMPGIDGYEMSLKIRGDERLKCMKLVAVTTDIRPGAAHQAKESGFNAYIPRPIVKGDFIRIIRTAMGDKRGDKKEGQIVTRHMAEELACKGLKILVVEDNPVNQKLLQIVLKNLGCEGDVASNGAVAIEKLKTNSYDLVLMDLQMPVMGGCEATEIIRKEISETLPVIALTAAAMKEDEEKSLAAGMNDYIPKPVELHKLREKIMQWAKYGA